MAKFRKKPVVIEAIRWTGSNIDEALKFIADGHDNFDHLPKDPNSVQKGSGVGFTPPTGELHIPTLEGTHIAKPGDMIIRGVKGEFYPCKPDIFEATYEEVK